MVFACAPSVGSEANAKAATALRRPSTTAGGAVIESWRPRSDVTECGASVRGVKIGDRVAGVTMGGGAMAEETVANAASVFPVPDGVTLEQAAAFPVAFGTAHLAPARIA